jgi:hypothetical protein
MAKKPKDSNLDKFTLTHIPEQDDLKTTTEFFLSQSAIGASTVKVLNFNGSIPNDSISLEYTKMLLEKAFERVRGGDLAILEEMLLGQAFALNMAFNSLSARATRQLDISTIQMLMNLCFKAQNQSRATIDSLIRLKQPSNTQFIKQANIAQGHQQVNNLAEKNITPQNELLEDIHGNSHLDTGTTTAPKGIDTTLEALDEVHRG